LLLPEYHFLLLTLGRREQLRLERGDDVGLRAQVLCSIKIAVHLPPFFVAGLIKLSMVHFAWVLGILLRQRASVDQDLLLSVAELGDYGQGINCFGCLFARFLKKHLVGLGVALELVLLGFFFFNSDVDLLLDIDELLFVLVEAS